MNEKGYIDLHTHSLFSDGSMTPTELVAHAAEHGLAAIALTDHDTVAGLDEAKEAGKRFGVEIVPGVEFSTLAKTQVHILGYYFDPNCPLMLKAFAAQQEERKITHQKYLELLNAHGFKMNDEDVRKVAPIGGIGRAHYARVMLEKGYIGSVEEAFRLYLGVGMPCYVERNVMHPAEAVRLIHAAGGVAFFAHPHQTKLPDDELFAFMKELKEAGLDGIEGYYTEYTPDMESKFRGMAKDLALSLSGGSDYHAKMKPHIEIGVGTGNLRIPYSVLAHIKELAGVYEA